MKRDIYDEDHEDFRASVRQWLERSVIPNTDKFARVEPDVKANVRLKRQEETPARPQRLRRRLHRRPRDE